MPEAAPRPGGARERIIPAVPTLGAGAQLLASPWLVTGEDYLRLQILSGIEGYLVAIHWRMLTPAGIVQVFRHTLAANPGLARVPTQTDFALGAGLLLNVGVIGAGAPMYYGGLFARVTLNRGLGAASVLLGTLLSDYVTARWGIGWPGSPLRNPAEAVHTTRYITGVAPPPGTELSAVVPSNARWELISWAARLTTSAAIATRFLAFYMDDGAAANELFSSSHPVQMTAGFTVLFSYAQGMPLSTAPLGNNTDGTAGLPTGLLLPGGARWRTLTVNIQPDDQWGAQRFIVRELIDDL